MTARQVALYTLILVVAGAGWGVTQPLSKIAVSTGHGPFGLIFWQMLIGAVAMAVLLALRGRPLPLNRAAFRVYLVIALIGTLLPNSAGYVAIAHLPSGFMSVLLSLVPLYAFPIALMLGLERFAARRLVGLLTGLAGIALLVLPEASLPDRAALIWVPVALVSGLCYACEGNIVARWGTAGLGPSQVLCGASALGAALILPVALATGQFISPLAGFGPPEQALAAASLVHVAVYTAYVWLVGRAGPVFAVQVSYLVTGFGVFWAMLILGETYAPYFWAAMALVLVGVFLVQPRRQRALAPDPAIKQT